MSAIQVLPWSSDREDAIAAFVSTHPYGLIYYTPPFRRYLLAVAGGQCRSRICLEDGQVAGVMPVLVKDGPFGSVLNSLPFFGSYGGVLASSAAAESALRAEYDRLAAGVAAATWISHPFMDSPAPRHDLTDQRIAQWTMLTPDGALPQTVESSARRNVQKAQASGVTVRESADALPFLEQTHRENMAAIGGRAKPEAFFSQLAVMTHGRDWRLYVAEHGREPIAALLTFEAAATVEYVMPAVSESARSLQPTALILAKAMADAASRAMTRWNWGGTWLSQDGVYRFKKKWGASERPYRYFITLGERSLMQRTPEELSTAYPWYFTLPFDRLAATELRDAH
jgi:hypothetical protein